MDDKDIRALYAAARAADDEFQRQLERVYGKKNAGDARYFRAHADAGVVEARKAFHKASQEAREASWAAFHQTTEGGAK